MSREDQRTRRYPCAFCGEVGAWPDRCSEVLGQAEGKVCDVTIPQQCARGDHRRCDRSACVVAARWHEPVRRAGVAAARAAGAVWAVVSTLEDQVTVVGTSCHLGRAKTILQATHARRFGYRTDDPELRGLVYVVRGSDGGFF